MGDLASRLAHLFVQSIPTIIFVFFLLGVLDRLLFRKLAEVMEKRKAATVGALAQAREQAAAAELRAREYEAAFLAVKHEIYRQREVERRQALGEREEMLQQAKHRAEDWLSQAQAELAEQVKATQRELETASRALALQITETVLGSGPSAEANSGRQS